MSHIRARIRQKVVAALEAIEGLTVFDSFGLTLTDAELPAISIVTNQENAGQVVMRTIGSDPIDVDLRLIVSLYVRGDSSVLQADNICAEIQKIIYQNPKWDGLAKCTDYVGFTQDLLREGDGTHAAITLEFNINYVASASDFTTSL